MLKDAVPLGEIARALVIKLRHHGDVLLAAPVLAALKAQAPQLEIDALVYDDTAPMLEGHPALAQLHWSGGDWKREDCLSQVRAGKAAATARCARARYDLLVHLTEQPRGAWLARALGARYSVAPAAPGAARFWAQLHAPLSAGAQRPQAHGRAEPRRAAPHRHPARHGRAPPAVRAGRRGRASVAALLAAEGSPSAASSTCTRPRAGASSAGPPSATPS